MPGRLYGAGILPTIYSPERTADYIQKLKAWGYVAMQIPSHPRAERVWYNGSKWDVMWDAIEESGIPLLLPHRREPQLPRARRPRHLPHDGLPALPPPLVAAHLLRDAGAPPPRMNVIFTEGGISWVPAALYDADKTYRQFESEMKPQLAEMPSYYWFRQCYATFMDDPSGIKILDDIGPEHALWSADYPHPREHPGREPPPRKVLLRRPPRGPGDSHRRRQRRKAVGHLGECRPD